MSEFVRLFVALDIPESVRQSLAALAADLRKLCSSARWVNLGAAHVTLKFIGEVPAAQLEKIQQALAAVPTPAPFDLRFAGLGFFPSERRPSVFWAGINGGEQLPRLAAAIEAAFVPLGIPKETRDFRPHLTLARLADAPRAGEPRPDARTWSAPERSGPPAPRGLGKGALDATGALRAAVAERASKEASADFGSARIEQFHLYQSILKRSGAEYTRLSSYALSGCPSG